MGWIKVDRGITENWIWDAKPFSFGQAWLDLLLSANWRDTKRIYKGNLIEQRAGEVVTTIKGLADKWGWDRKKVKQFLDALEADYMVYLTTSTHGVRIRIANWHKYQNEENQNAKNGTTSDTEIPTLNANRGKTKGQPTPQPKDNHSPQQKKKEEEKENKEGDTGDEATEGRFVPCPEELKAKILNGFKM